MGASGISIGLGLGAGRSATSSGHAKPVDSFSNTLSGLLDGTNDHFDPSATFTSIWSGSFSISLWYKAPSSFPAGVDNFLGNDAVVGQGYIEFRYRQTSSSAAKIELYHGDSYSSSSPYNTYGAETGSILSANSWHHLVWVASRPGSGGTTSTLYLNGSSQTLSAQAGFESSLSNAGGTFSNNTLIGARNNASSGSGSGELFLPGHLDEMAIFNSALSASDVSTIYNSGVPGNLEDLSPSHWWRFGDGTGDTNSGGGTPASGDTIGTVADQSGSENAVAVNGPTYSDVVKT